MLSIITVNYNSLNLMINSLKSVVEQTKDVDYEVIVVDNDFHEANEKTIREVIPNVRYIDIGYNSGYARANNLGILQARGEYILLLNPDTILLNNAIKKTLDFFKEKEKNEQIGMATCTVFFPDMSPQVSVYYEPISLLNFVKLNPFIYLIKTKLGFPNKKNGIKALQAAFVLTKKEILANVGLFDTDFFLYSEDTELSYRFTKKGFTLEICEDASIIHISNASSPKRNAQELRNLSRILLILKIKGHWTLLPYFGINLFNYFCNLIIYPIKSKEGKRLVSEYYPALLSGFRRYIFEGFPKTVEKKFDKNLSADKNSFNSE